MNDMMNMETSKSHNDSKSEPNMIPEEIQKYTNILRLKKNIILQGAPGTGKTYNTAALALTICGVTDVDMNDHEAVMERYDELQKEGRIGFVTFHQSMDYEDFVEGIKPKTENGIVSYEVEDGIFKLLSNKAQTNIEDDYSTTPYVLIIDEINRGNVSKIFGELITLLEVDKRTGGNHPIRVMLPYSKESFGVPSNLYIIGTMNTTDRSVGNIDYAVRRRFAFATLKADKELVKQNSIPLAVELFEAVELFIKKHQIDMDFEDLMVGHSYFFAKDENELELKWQYEILPLLNEYIKDGIVSAKPINSDMTVADFVGIND
ncbi:MAG: AAA family ATPase [Bacteroidales bacterium]|nr:AAA family ATPase [Bacteroidales bacterium]